MKSEEFYKKHFGDAECVPKEDVIRLLRTFARAMTTVKRQSASNGGPMK